MKKIVIFGKSGTLSEDLGRALGEGSRVVTETADPREYFRSHTPDAAILCADDPSEFDAMAVCPVPFFAVAEDPTPSALDAALRNHAAYIFRMPPPLRVFADHLADAIRTHGQGLDGQT